MMMMMMMMMMMALTSPSPMVLVLASALLGCLHRWHVEDDVTDDVMSMVVPP